MKQRLVGSALLAIAAGYVAGTSRFEAGFIADPIGPSAFPYGIGTLLVLACLAHLVAGDAGRLPELSWRHGVLGVTLVAYVIVLDFLGFVVTTTLLAAVIATLFGGPLKRSIVMSLLLCVAIFVLFVYGLSIPLPRGF